MKSIHKFALSNFRSNPTVEMPIDARVLSVQMQYNTMCVWALVDTECPKVEHEFSLYGTGKEVILNKLGKFIDTVQCGPEVWHVFYNGPI